MILEEIGQEQTQKLQKLEQSWREQRASALAQGLVAQEPCPVCGSLEHPKPATIPVESIGDEQIDDARATLADLQAQSEKRFYAQHAFATLIEERLIESKDHDQSPVAAPTEQQFEKHWRDYEHKHQKLNVDRSNATARRCSPAGF